MAEPPLRLGAPVLELRRGIICAPPEAGRRAAPGTLSGWIHVPDSPLVMRAEGARVPAVLGMGFGVRFTLAGDQPYPLRYVVSHPPMPPGGEVEQVWHGLVAPGGPEQVFYQFDLVQELLPGRWSIAAFSGTQELFHAAFDVVTPETLPALADLCKGPGHLAFSQTAPGVPD